MSKPEGAMPEATINFVNQTLAGIGRDVQEAVHVPMAEAEQRPPAEDALYTAFRKPLPLDAACDLPDPLYDPRHRIAIEGLSSEGPGVDPSITIVEPSESGHAAPGSDFQVSAEGLARIAALYRGEDPNALA